MQHRDGHLWTRKQFLTRHQIRWYLDHGLPSLQNCKQHSVASKKPRVQYSIIAAMTDKDRDNLIIEREPVSSQLSVWPAVTLASWIHTTVYLLPLPCRKDTQAWRGPDEEEQRPFAKTSTLRMKHLGSHPKPGLQMIVALDLLHVYFISNIYAPVVHIKWIQTFKKVGISLKCPEFTV